MILSYFENFLTKFFNSLKIKKFIKIFIQLENE